MEGIADPNGFRQEVLDGIFLHKGWLGEHLPRLSKSGGKVVNSRGPCPRLCQNRHRPAYRRDCSKKRCTDDCPKGHRPITRADCPMRESVEALVLLEHKRRKQEGQFIAYLKKEGVECCGTVPRCPLHK
ncbi:E2 domain-associated cysteine-rich protein [Erythrobacter sp. SCSIO 43205]|uniref:E2 domain-associated cysteine-rich protein n=1 Tax=Erythrobacter sp. SCSIO 43205 TaxID=2779361 RepID=UPI00351CC251